MNANDYTLFSSKFSCQREKKQNFHKLFLQKKEVNRSHLVQIKLNRCDKRGITLILQTKNIYVSFNKNLFTKGW
jgi:hypothetical protein